MEKENRRFAAKAASAFGCVLLAAMAAVQILMLVCALDGGLYAGSVEQSKKRVVERSARSTADNIFDFFTFMEQEDAEQHIADWYSQTNLNYTIEQNGVEIFRLENWTGTLADEYEFEYNWYPEKPEDNSGAKDNGKEMVSYRVSCQVPATPVYNDYLAWEWKFWDFMVDFRYGIFVTLGISVLGAVILFIVAVKSTGKHQEDGSLRLRFVDRIPMDLYLILFSIVVIFACSLLDSWNYAWDGYWYPGSPWIFMVWGSYAAAMAALLLQFAGSCAVRASHGRIFKNSFLYRIYAWIRKYFRLLREWLHSLRGNASLLGKGAAAFCGICFLELVVTVSCWWSSIESWVLLFLVEKLALLFLLCVALANMKRLRDAGRKIAAGDLQYQTDTSHMLWEFKRFGDTLNQISNGMQCAVGEQMKSERFRTELITNVSHDIKTPLTSIINYVDLLSREEIANPEAKEYLEVLNRQSARLKKLIEDLIEASKASSGTLNVQWEDCEVGVMLTQAAGEYEERLEQNGLELILRQPEETFMIRADGRHLWRVFDNLLNNIHKYAQPGTRVYLDLEQKGGQLAMIFRNTSRYALHMTGEELVQRFTRGDSSRNTEGSGLGLSIAQSLTELMGGSFELYIDGDLFKVVLTFPCKNKLDNLRDNS